MALVAGTLGLAGCASRASVGVAAGYRVDEPVEVSSRHVHSASCGHYRRHGRWYYAPHHVHHSGCGHVLRGGAWVLID